MERKNLNGTSLVGTSTTRQRIENDYYATPFWATQAILERERLEGSILEPAAGEGHISKVIRDYYPYSEITATELVEREDKFDCGINWGIDFLKVRYCAGYDNMITNPPFSLMREFAEKGLEITRKKVLLFGRINFLETQERYKFLTASPLRTVYVFSRRVAPLRNGADRDENGKPWASTMCFAWYVWEHGYTGKPVIEWLA